MPKKRRPPTPCVLCGSVVDSTQEDVFPRWARDALVTRAREFHIDVTSLPPRVVMSMCREHNAACSVLERAAASLLKPLVLGDRPVTLDAHALRAVAEWAYMKDIEYQLLRPHLSSRGAMVVKTADQLVHQRGQLSTFLARRRLPATYSLRIGAWNPDLHWSIHVDLFGGPFVDRRYAAGHLWTISSVNPVGLCVFESLEDPDQIRLLAHERAVHPDPRLVRIWPPVRPGVVVPNTVMGPGSIAQLIGDWGHDRRNVAGRSFVISGPSAGRGDFPLAASNG